MRALYKFLIVCLATPLLLEATDLQVTKSVSPNPVQFGEEVTFTIIVDNTSEASEGPYPSPNTVVTDLMPEGFSVSSVETTRGTWDTDWVGEQEKVTVLMGTVAAKTKETIIIKALALREGEFIPNTATVVGDEYDPNESNNEYITFFTVLPPVPMADINVVKTAPDNVPYGEPFKYIIHVVNNGPDTAENVVLTENLPVSGTKGGLAAEFIDQGSISIKITKPESREGEIPFTGTPIVIQLGSMPENELVEIEITVAPVTRTILNNTATATTSTMDPNSENNDDSTTTIVRPRSWFYDPGGTSNDPVATGTGEFFFVGKDLLFERGPMNVSFNLNYGSYMSYPGSVSRSMGANWSHNFDWYLIEDPNGDVRARDPRSQLKTFFETGDRYQLADGSPGNYQLTLEEDVYYLLDTDSGNVLSFGRDGLLRAIHNTKGATLSVIHDQGRLSRVQDDFGRSISMSYDGDLLAAVTDGERTATFTHTDGMLTEVTDPTGAVTRYTYTSTERYDGLIETITSPNGDVVLQNSYDEEGRVVQQIDAVGQITDFIYEELIENQLLTTIDRPDGRATKHLHDINIQLRQVTDSDGGELDIDYGPDGKPETIVSPTGETASITHESSNGHIDSIILADSTGPIHTYEAREFHGLMISQMTKLENPDGTNEAFTYDNSGNLSSRKDADGQMWTFTHNDLGQVLTKTHPLGGTVTRTYDSLGNLETVTDPASNTVTYAYDTLNRRISVTRADGTLTSYEYDALNRVSFELTSGRNIDVTYDANGNITHFLRDIGVTNFTYDAADRLVEMKDPAGAMTRYTYDSNGNISSITDPLGRVRMFEYNDRDQLLSRTDGAGRNRTYEYDEADRLISTTSPGGDTTTYTYDSLGLRSTVTDGNNASNLLSYDDMGRLSSVTDPEGITTRYAYSPNGALSGMQIGDHLISEFERNPVGLIDSMTDSTNSTWMFEYDSSGRRVSKTDPVGQKTTYAYDSRNRLSEIDFPGEQLHTISYDPFGNITRVDAQDGSSLAYSYDPFDRLTSAGNFSASYNMSGDPVSANGLLLEHDGAHQLTKVTYTDSSEALYTYDDSGRVLSVSYSSSTHSANTSFVYDSRGNRISVSRSNGNNSSYGWDSVGRLIFKEDKAASKPAADIAIDIDRDGRGDMVSSTRSQPLEILFGDTSTDFSYNSLNQVSGWVYDPVGRRTQDDTFTYTWDQFSRLVELKDDTSSWGFEYDGMGNLTLYSDTDFNSTGLRWNPALNLPSIAEILDIDGLTKFVHAPSGELLFSVHDTRGVRFYHYDEAGNTLMLTDENGDIGTTYAYSPYGQVIGTGETENNPFTFGGQVGVFQLTDSHFLMRQRVYDNHSRQFLSPDPLSQSDPLKLNTYSYAAGNPLRYTDPTGLNPTTSGQSGLDTASDVSTGVSTGSAVVETLATGLQGAPSLPGGSSSNIIDGVADKANDAMRRTGRLQAKALDNLDNRRVNDLYDRAKGLSNKANRARDVGSKAKGAGGVATVVGVGAALGETAIDTHRIAETAQRGKRNAYKSFDNSAKHLMKAIKEGKLTGRQANRRLSQLMRLLDDQLDGIEDSAEADIFYEAAEGLIESLKALVPAPLP